MKDAHARLVAERILERAEEDGMRIRVFRPGFILGSTKTGACNDKDLIWNVLTSGLAVGAPVLPRQQSIGVDPCRARRRR